MAVGPQCQVRPGKRLATEREVREQGEGRQGEKEG